MLEALCRPAPLQRLSVVLGLLLWWGAVTADAQDLSHLDPTIAPMAEAAVRLQAEGSSAEALGQARSAIDKARALYGDDDGRIAEVAAAIAQPLEAAGERPELIRILETGWRKLRLDAPVGSPARQAVVDVLTRSYLADGLGIEAEFLAEAEARDRADQLYATRHVGELFGRDGVARDPTAHFEITFQLAQAPTSEASVAVSRMAIRRSAASMDERALLRERQDLFEDWRALSSQDARGTRTGRGKASIRDRVAAIDAKLALIAPRAMSRAGEQRRSLLDNTLGGGGSPMSLEQARTALDPSEALLVFLHVPGKISGDELFLWLVTDETYGSWRIDLGERTLADRVDALRCGLDHTAWAGEGLERCNRHLGRPANADRPAATDLLPFDHAGAHDLYARLFAPIKSAVAGKHLLVAPSGPLTRLPFNVLITAPPSPTAGDEPRWLPLEHAVSVLPAANALKALRGKSLPSGSDQQMLAFANPVLDGDETGLDESARKGLRLLRAAARYRQRCDLPPSLEEVTIAFAQTSAFLGGDVASEVRSWTPVPSTATQVCEIAQAPGLAGSSRVVLADEATERTLRRMNASGELERYRIIQFATHGALAGQMSGNPEPGLILTPPATIQTSDDDGFLSTSEVADLKLNADWVILSACNTAAARTGSDEALSGLASAFFYADARALLVSHWEVYTRAAVTLIREAIVPLRASRLGGDNFGRAEAVRRAMVDVIRTGDALERHPAFWAPFVLVGEGGAGR
ncbi:MAG: CHAT domain-containing protein [Hyphomicrobiaceae bacterium]|nr:CHAT domain-containing protein [Hyphomicrobiaceae bacterium]